MHARSRSLQPSVPYRVVAVSDLHGYLPEMPPADLYLLAGDLCPVTDHRLPAQAAWLGGPFAEWLSGLQAPVVGIAGNHDFIFERALDRVPELPWIYLRDSGTIVDGLNIFGTPWQPRFFDWAFNLDEDDLALKWGAIPDDTDILVVHGPPRGYGDFTNFQHDHAGSPSLLRRIEEIHLRLAVFGHIHEGYGRWEIDGTTLANVSLLDDQYRVANQPTVFEL